MDQVTAGSFLEEESVLWRGGELKGKGICFWTVKCSQYRRRRRKNCISGRDLKLGLKRLSLHEFEILQLRPLGHHGRYLICS